MLQNTVRTDSAASWTRLTWTYIRKRRCSLCEESGSELIPIFFKAAPGPLRTPLCFFWGGVDHTKPFVVFIIAATCCGNLLRQATGPPRQATGPPSQGAGVGVGMLMGDSEI